MALGTSRPKNGGREWQNGVLAIELSRHQLAYQVTDTRHADRKLLWLTPSAAGLTLPLIQSYCCLEHVCRGRWLATSEFNGRVMAVGCSITDVIGKVIRATYNVPTPWGVADFPEANPDPLWWS